MAEEKKDISYYRAKIDEIDKNLVGSFAERMGIAAKIAEYKKEKGLGISDISRERSKLSAVIGMVPDDLKEYISLLYPVIFELSKSYQGKMIGKRSELSEDIQKAVEVTPDLFPSGIACACQGVEGAYSQLACDRLIKNANIMYFSSFDTVFSAVEKGLCRFGIIPVENSTAGSVNAVYDLMLKHRFSIVRSIRVKIDHSLSALSGTDIADIREIYSHEQALSQCSGFLSGLKDVKVIPCENTAVAARMVGESGRKDIAAISSKTAAKLYGLSVLKESVQDQMNNYTRFICISKKLEIYPGADRTSLIVTLPHSHGALYRIMSRFYALGINLLKLESRPIPGKDFEFRFYFDLDVPVYSPALLQLIDELPALCESFSYLGSYSEVI